MFTRDLMILTYLGIMGGLRLTSTTTTTTLVAAMSLANQDLERYFRQGNATHAYATMNEERIALDSFTYAFISYTFQKGSNSSSVVASEERARYGEGLVKNVTGKLVHITDAYDETDDLACKPNIKGTKGSELPAKGIPWVALIRRGSCKFEDKVKHVANKGAAGVIVFNDKPVLALEKMQIKNKNRDITAVLTYQEDGLSLLRLLNDDFEVNVNITEGKSGVRPVNTLNRTSVLFVSVSFIVLMIVSLVWLIFYYIQRFRYLQAKDQQSRNLCSVTKKAIMKIPTKTGKSTDEKDADSDCCAICIEAYKASDVIRILPCKHEFHKNCIDPWLIEHRTCPMCKLDVLKFYGYVFLGSEESILEFAAERPVTNAAPIVPVDGIIANNSQQQPTRTSALSDLIRSRDFVIDFPRVFVLDGATTTGTHESLFPARLPERSQSSLSLAYAKDWMSAVTNKLDEQHGLKRIRKSSGQPTMQENLLGVQRVDARKRRSRSADGRYSNGYFGRLETMAKKKSDEDENQEGQSTPVASGSRYNSRRNSEALRTITDASYAKSRQRLREDANRRRVSLPRGSEISLRVSRRAGPSGSPRPNGEAVDDVSPNNDIKIQINGEGFEF